ncbi:hypothetical protein AADH33_03440 [Psychrobacter sp. KFRI-CH2-11]|uniref:hypothetical protein n=1 Tax=Psychrobacter sp. KFRI-CH2-11 TaxID=3156079 RepID=UPI0032557119
MTFSSRSPIRKPKEKPALTIILALLLHVWLAIIIYFTVFDHKNTPESQDLMTRDKPVISAPSSTENTKATANQVAINDIEAISTTVSINTAEPTVPQMLTSNRDVATQNHKSQKQSPSPKPTSSQTQSLTEENLSPVSHDDSATYDEPITKKPQNLPKHQLQKTKEYQVLEDEMDEDSEQLSTLINEIKQRNQQQIDSQHVTQPIEPSVPANPTDEVLIPDYPITPITSLDKSKSN